MSGALIAAIVFLSVVLIVLAVLSVPLNFYIDYVGGELFVELRFLFYKKRFLPKQQNKQKQHSQQKADKPKDAKKEGFFDTAARFLELFSSGGSLGRLALSLHKANLSFEVTVGGEDAAEIAIGCGKMSAYLHTASAVISNVVSVKKRKIKVAPDYNAKNNSYVLSARFWSRPISYIFNIHKIVPLLLRIADAI